MTRTPGYEANLVQPGKTQNNINAETLINEDSDIDPFIHLSGVSYNIMSKEHDFHT